MAPPSIRVLIADDHPVVRGGMKLLLDSEADVDVVGEAPCGRTAVELAGKLRPDVVLMDLMMPEINGIEATRRIRKLSPRTRVLVLTSFGSDEKLFPALDAGATGFLLKDSSGEELVAAIHRVARGKSALSPRVADRLVRNFSHGPDDAPADHLTGREIEVLRVLAHGYSNEEIAERLTISPATVRTHLSQIFAKLGLTRRTQAMLYALKHDIASLDDDDLPN